MVSDGLGLGGGRGGRAWRVASDSGGGDGGSCGIMSRDYGRLPNYYLPVNNIPPTHQHYQHYDMSQGSAVAAQGAYELTACAGDAGLAHAPLHHHHDVRKRNAAAVSRGESSSSASCRSREVYEAGSCETSAPATTLHNIGHVHNSKKRKSSIYGASSCYDDDTGEESASSRSVPDKKQNHSEIEKRRRDKMNTYITELSAIVPMCGALSRKLDKLTVLRMAVQHMRSVRGALSNCPMAARPRPAFLSEREVNSLILDAAEDCFLLVVGCDRGRLLYVSTSVKNMLQYDQSELLGQSLFDILHPKDVAKVKEQFSSSDLSPRERLIDAKTMLPVKADVVAGASCLCTGARRSFFCRIKCKSLPQSINPPNTTVKEECELTAQIRKNKSEKKYCVVHCTGYLKSWAPVEVSETGESTEDGDASNLSCLVAMARKLPSPVVEPQPACLVPTRGLDYMSRHTPDGKFLFVDQRVTLVLGFLPQELIGTSLYEYVSGPELEAIAKTHKAALIRREALLTPPYNFRKKDGSLARITTHFKPFRNPWTKDVESIVANNTLIGDSSAPSDEHAFEDLKQTEAVTDWREYLSESGSGIVQSPGAIGSNLAEEEKDEMKRLIESHKLGSAIAEEALQRTSADMLPEMPADLLHENVFTQQNLVDNILGGELGYNEVRNNVPLSSARVESPLPAQPCSPTASSPLTPLAIDGNGEAAMAVIMSLLEADAGLGGPVNFSGLPWPLP